MDTAARVKAFLCAERERAIELLVRFVEEAPSEAARKARLEEVFAAMIRAPECRELGEKDAPLGRGRFVPSRVTRRVRALHDSVYGSRPGMDCFHDMSGSLWFAVLRFPETRNWAGADMLEHLQKVLRVYLTAAEAASDRGFVTVLDTVTTVLEIARQIDGREVER